jgi:nitrate/nitrite transport system substrate-binding protein
MDGASWKTGITRREMMRRMAALGMGAAVTPLFGCAAGGENAPAEAGSDPIRIGFIPLTDCASVVMAHELGLYAKHGVNVVVEKQTSWPIIRDKLASGELHAAHCLFGMPFAAASGVSEAPGDPLQVAMMLNNNGQATTLSTQLFGGGIPYADYGAFRAGVEELRRTKEPTFAMTFPGGTHDIWMHLTLATAGIDPASVRITPIPPPQMVANMEAGNMDGYNVGEPWGGVAVARDVGFTFVATQTLWKHHPEKALVVNGRFASERRAELKGVMKAILEASAWLDDMANRGQAAATIGSEAYVNAPADVIDARLMGHYDLGGGLGSMDFADDMMLFHRGGETNFPRVSHGVWFLAQYARFGRLAALPPETQAMAGSVILQDLYREVAGEVGVAVPDDDMTPFTVEADGIEFDPNHPEEALGAYAELFQSRANAT